MQLRIDPIGVVRGGFEVSDILIYPESEKYLKELAPDETILIFLLEKKDIHQVNILSATLLKINGNFLRLDTKLPDNSLVIDIYTEKELLKG